LAGFLAAFLVAYFIDLFSLTSKCAVAIDHIVIPL
jgi:hypothetical protein